MNTPSIAQKSSRFSRLVYYIGWTFAGVWMIATLTLWARSYSTADWIRWNRGAGGRHLVTWDFFLATGTLVVQRYGLQSPQNPTFKFASENDTFWKQRPLTFENELKTSLRQIIPESRRWSQEWRQSGSPPVSVDVQRWSAQAPVWIFFIVGVFFIGGIWWCGNGWRWAYGSFIKRQSPDTRFVGTAASNDADLHMNKEVSMSRSSRLWATFWVTGMAVCCVAPYVFSVVDAEKNVLYAPADKVILAALVLLIMVFCGWIIVRLYDTKRPGLFLVTLIASFPLILVGILSPLIFMILGGVYRDAWLRLTWFGLYVACYIAAWVVVWPWYNDR